MKTYAMWEEERKRLNLSIEECNPCTVYLEPGDETDLRMALGYYLWNFDGRLNDRRFRCADPYLGISRIIDGTNDLCEMTARIEGCLAHFLRIDPLGGRACVFQWESAEGKIPNPSDRYNPESDAFETFRLAMDQNGGVAQVFYLGLCFRAETEPGYAHAQCDALQKNWQERHKLKKQYMEEMFGPCKIKWDALDFQQLRETYGDQYWWCAEQLDQWLYDPRVSRDEFIRKGTALAAAYRAGTGPSREACAQKWFELYQQITDGVPENAKTRLFAVVDAHSVWPTDLPPRTAVVQQYEPAWGLRYAQALSTPPPGLAGRVFRLALRACPAEDGDMDASAARTCFGQAVALAEFIYAAWADGWNLCFCSHEDPAQDRNDESAWFHCVAAIIEHFYGTGVLLYARHNAAPNQTVLCKLLSALAQVRQRRLSQEKHAQ